MDVQLNDAYEQLQETLKKNPLPTEEELSKDDEEDDLPNVINFGE